MQHTESIYPHLHLLVSGGNSQIILLTNWHNWRIIGQTKDDAVGECLDKVGRMLGFAYPGGVTVARIAGLLEANFCGFPTGMNKQKQKNDYDLSFAGLKTAVRYFLQNSERLENFLGRKVTFYFEKLLDTKTIQELLTLASQVKELQDQGLDHLTLITEVQKRLDQLPANLELIYKVCVSVQTVAIQQLINKLDSVLTNANLLLGNLEEELQVKQIRSIGLSGGVSANLLLRQKVRQLASKYQLSKVFIPPLSLTGDNAVMIALAGIADLYC